MKRTVSRVAATVAALGCILAVVGATAAESVAAGTLPTITVALTGKAVTVGGYTGSGAVNVATTVTGEKTGSVALVRLNPGVDFSAFALAAQAVTEHNGDLNYIDPYGAIVFDQPVVKGSNVAQTILTPGKYIALDEGGPAQVPPHAFFVVQSSPYAIATLPAPAATLSTIEFGFRGSKTLRNGSLIRVSNAGFLVHMADAFRVKSMTAAKQLTAALRSGAHNRSVQKLILGQVDFFDPSSPGMLSQYVLHATPGIYVVACFMQTQDGREHARLGMERTIRITK